MERLQFWRFENSGVRALMGVYAQLTRSGLDRSLLDLVFLRVSQLNRCAECADVTSREAIAHGIAPGQVNAVAAWRESPLFDERQRAALAWAEIVTEISEAGASDDAYREAASHFSDTEFVDLTLAIALTNAFSRIAVAFHHGPPPVPALIEDAAATTG